MLKNVKKFLAFLPLHIAFYIPSEPVIFPSHLHFSPPRLRFPSTFSVSAIKFYLHFAPPPHLHPLNPPRVLVLIFINTIIDSFVTERDQTFILKEANCSGVNRTNSVVSLSSSESAILRRIEKVTDQ